MFAGAPMNIRETWYRLREFETRDITARSYKARHSRELSAAKARQISSSFIQAREYFRNASEADFTVRPVLQYYGVSALSLGTALFLAPQLQESSITPSHGLTTYEWQNVLSNGPRTIGHLRIRLTKGVLHDLLVATGNTFYFRHNSSAVNWRIGAGVPELDSEFTFEEVAARIPDVSQQYVAWTGTPFPSMSLGSFKSLPDENRYEFVVPVSSRASVDAIFPEDRCENRTTQQDSTNIIISHNRSFVPFLAQKSAWLNIGGVVLYPPLNSNKYFTPLAASFISSYVLGMLCRYFPTTWTGLARSEKGDAVYPLVIRLLDWIEDTFPAMVVDMLRGPYEFEKKV